MAGSSESAILFAMVEAIGNLAAILIVAAYTPQLIKVVKGKSAAGMSGLFIGTLFTAVVLFLIYGVLIANIPLVITNGFSLIQVGIMLYYKIKYK